MERQDASDLINEGAKLCDSGNLEEGIKYFTEAAQLDPDNIVVFCNWGTALSDLAQIKQDESLFRESFEKYDKATQIQPDNVFAFFNWGLALYDLAKIKKDKSLFREAAEYFKKSKLDILDILVSFDDIPDREYIVETDILYPILDSDTDDGRFFKETTKSIDDFELDKYKRAYILSIFVISQLHINDENEKFVATYRDKTTSQKILFDNSKFRLNAINYSNDPTEGKILLDYLFDEKKRTANESLNREYGAFAGCFIFNHDSLNQFRLYGKEAGREGTGLSLILRNSFFSKEAKMAIKQPKQKIAMLTEKKENMRFFAVFTLIPKHNGWKPWDTRRNIFFIGTKTKVRQMEILWRNGMITINISLVLLRM